MDHSNTYEKMAENIYDMAYKNYKLSLKKIHEETKHIKSSIYKEKLHDIFTDIKRNKDSLDEMKNLIENHISYKDEEFNRLKNLIIDQQDTITESFKKYNSVKNNINVVNPLTEEEVDRQLHNAQEKARKAKQNANNAVKGVNNLIKILSQPNSPEAKAKRREKRAERNASEFVVSNPLYKPVEKSVEKGKPVNVVNSKCFGSDCFGWRKGGTRRSKRSKRNRSRKARS